MKICADCGQEKPFSDFKKRSGGKYYYSYCKVCVSKRNCASYQKHKEKRVEAQKEYYQSNKEKILLRSKETYDPDKKKKYNDEYRKKNWEDIKNKRRDYYRVWMAGQRARKNKATPCWLTEGHLSEIDDVYWLARDLERVSGEKYHVDHIIPLKGKNVCGLHVPWNLQVLPADVNIRKSNNVLTQNGQ